jgi:hypothetical protein
MRTGDGQEKETYMFPPSSLICIVTTASPIQTMAKTPENTKSFCPLNALKLSSRLSSKQNTNGPHKSQSRSPSLMPPPASKLSTSVALPAKPTSSSLAPLNPASLIFVYAPRKLVVFSSIEPPNRYFGYSTSRILDQTARRSRRRVSHTDSSIVFPDARRSSPGMREVKYELELLPMLPVRGAREEVDCWCWRGSSRSSRLAGACKHIFQIYNRTEFEEVS